MRIGIDARYLNGGYSGIATYSERMLTYLNEIDKKNEYFVFVHSNYSKQIFLNKNFEIIKIPKKPLSFWTLFSAWKTINDLKLDIFHSFFPICPIFYRGKIIITLHDLQPFIDPFFSSMRNVLLESAYNLFYRWIYPLSIKKSKWVISVSHSTKDILSTIIKDSVNKTIVVHSGIDENFSQLPGKYFIEKTKEKYKIPEEYFLYLGSTRPNKNIPNMLKAFSLLKENYHEYNNLKFILCLSNIDRFFTNCYDIIKRLNIKINKDLIIYKNITEDEKKVLYLNSRFFCFVTKYEGFGIPLLEAQTLKIPVISCKSGSLEEISGGFALFVDPDDSEKIAKGMADIMQNNDLRKKLIDGGIRNTQRFNWKQTAQNIMDIYNYLT